MLPAAIEIVTDVAPESRLWIEADETQIHQVLVNLAVNARDAMPGGGTLRIGVAHQPAVTDAVHPAARANDRGHAMVVVEDTVVGMSAEVRSRIFEPFFTTKPGEQGTGLGMALARDIVADHRGHIEVESAPDRGTRVTLAFPCCDPPPARLETPAEQTLPTGRGETILLAEDNPQIRDVVAAALGAAGYDVLQSNDGLDATALVNTSPSRVRLLILDVDMPRMGGLACLTEIRKIRPDLPAIIISGMPGVGPDQFPLGHTVFMAKPFRLAELAARAHSLLGASSPPDPRAECSAADLECDAASTSRDPVDEPGPEAGA